MAVQSVFLRGEIYMRKTTTRMLALVLSTVMAVSGFAGFGGESKAYAAEAAQTVIADSGENDATPGDATPTDTRIDASEFKVELSSKSYVYDGKAKKPTVRVADNEGTDLEQNRDYTCVYSDNIYPGTASVIITYQGNYKGTATKTFTIKGTSVSGIKVSQTAARIKLSWSAVSNATGYTVMQKSGKKWVEIYSGKAVSATIQNLKASTGYSFVVKAQNNGKELARGSVKAYTNPAKVTGCMGGLTDKKNKNIITSSTSNSVELVWKAASGATGYRIYMYNSKAKSWKRIMTKTAGSVPCMMDGRYTYTVSGLESARGYKFKVSAYTKRGSKIYEGEKSDTVVSATTQKAGMTYETFFYYLNTPGSYKNLGPKQYVGLKNVSKTAGYYVSLVAISKAGKEKVIKTVKTNKAKNIITIPAKYQFGKGYTGGMNVKVKPYFNYGGKTYVGEQRHTYYVEKAFSRKNTDGFAVNINVDEKGRVMNYEIMIDRNTGKNTRMVILKYYSNNRKYIGMSKQYYKNNNLVKMFDYDSKGKLTSKYYR